MIELDARQTTIVAILTLFLGKYLNRKIPVLREYNIPEPVTGGLLVSILFGILYFAGNVEINFDLSIRDTLLIVFFSTIGLSSKIPTLIKGGKTLLILLVGAILYLVLQNITGISMAKAMGMSPYVGLLGGSVSLSGGHGTIIAWAPVFVERYGIDNALEIGIACATFGLVLGGLIGGPIAKYLINRHRLKSSEAEHITVGLKHDEPHEQIDADSFLNSVLAISLAIGLGLSVNEGFSALGLELPMFVSCLFAGIVLTNTLPYLIKNLEWPAGHPSLALISDVALGLFLAMSLMSLQLWSLIDLALPIVFILLAQLIVIVLFTLIVIFRIAGRDYDAAVMSAGYAGLALGATPTAIVNMTAVTKKFGASPKAFIVIPLIGAFFIDISNALIISTILKLIS